MKSVLEIYKKARRGKITRTSKEHKPSKSTLLARKFVDSISTRNGLRMYDLKHSKPISKKK